MGWSFQWSHSWIVAMILEDVKTEDFGLSLAKCMCLYGGSYAFATSSAIHALAGAWVGIPGSWDFSPEACRSHAALHSITLMVFVGVALQFVPTLGKGAPGFLSIGLPESPEMQLM